MWGLARSKSCEYLVEYTPGIELGGFHDPLLLAEAVGNTGVKTAVVNNSLPQRTADGTNKERVDFLRTIL